MTSLILLVTPPCSSPRRTAALCHANMYEAMARVPDCQTQNPIAVLPIPGKLQEFRQSCSHAGCLTFGDLWRLWLDDHSDGKKSEGDQHRKGVEGMLSTRVFCAGIYFAAALAFAPSPSRAEDIIIGAAIPFSGANATYGDDVKLGVDLGLADVNAHGGVLGRMLRVNYEDSQSDRAKAAAFFRKFADDPQVAAIFSYSTDEFVAVDPLATSLKVPDISLGSAGAISKIGPYSFRVMVIVNRVMDSVLKQLEALKHVKTIAVIYEASNNYTVTELAAVQRAAKDLGLQVTDVEAFSRGDQNFTLQLTRILQTKPDLLVVSAATNEAVPIIVQARSMGIQAPIFGGTSMNDPRIGQLAGPAALGVITYFPFDSADPRPIVRDFLAQLKAKTGQTAPSGHTATAFDATHLLADAIRRAGSTDREAIRAALGDTRNFEGVNGPYSYEGSGDNLTQNPHLFVWTEAGYQRLER